MLYWQCGMGSQVEPGRRCGMRRRRGSLFGGLTLRLWGWISKNSEAHLLSQRVGLIDSDDAQTPLSQLTLTAPLKGSL